MFKNTAFKIASVLLALLAVVAVAFALMLGHVLSPAGVLYSLAGASIVGLTFLQNDDAIKYLISIGFLDAAAGLRMQVKAKVADYAILSASDASGTVFTNRGAAGTVIFTLPAPAQAIAGVYYDFVTVVAQIMRVATAAADTLISDNDATADSLSTTARIGVSMRVFCDGTSWIATETSTIPAAAFAQTGTVAT